MEKGKISDDRAMIFFLAYANSDDSDQSAHSRGLIRFFTFSTKNNIESTRNLYYSKTCSDWMLQVTFSRFCNICIELK